MPISPSNSGSATKSALASRAVDSGVTTVQVSVSGIGFELLPLRQPLRLLLGLLDPADVHERVLRQMVPLAVANLLEAPDRIVDLRELARLAGEHLGHIARLRQEPLDAAGPVHDQLVI